MKKITILLLVSLMLFVACETAEDQLAEAIELLKVENYVDAEVIFKELLGEEDIDSSVEKNAKFGLEYISLGEEVVFLAEANIFDINTLKDLFKSYAEYQKQNEKHSDSEIAPLYESKLEEYKGIVDSSLDSMLSNFSSTDELEAFRRLLNVTKPPYPHRTRGWLTDNVLKLVLGSFQVSSESTNVTVDAGMLKAAIKLLSGWSELEDIITEKFLKLAKKFSRNKEYKAALEFYQAVYTITQDSSLQDTINDLELKVEKERILSKQNSFTSGTEVAVAIGGTEFRKYLGSRYTSGNARYVLVRITVRNIGNSKHHANPNDFTVADQWGNTCSYASASFSLNNYFDATDLNPGNQTSGWLAFIVNKDSEYYTLYCDDTYSNTIEKKFVVMD